MVIVFDNVDSGYAQASQKAALAALRKMNVDIKKAEIEINLVSEELITELNGKYRNIHQATDVLSFANINEKFPYNINSYPEFINPANGCLMLGEIFICVKKALEQAKEYGRKAEREIAFLTCHGVLHLLGYDHMNDEDEAEMNKLQDEIMKDFEKEYTDENSHSGEAEEKQDKNDFLSGFVALMGKPNSGKSTLVNTLVGEKVSIVSWKPQTTRNRIFGIYNDEVTQIVFIDTPGLHTPKNKLGEYMMKAASRSLEGADAVLYLIDAEKGFDERDKRNIETYIKQNFNTVAAVNKVDRVTKEKVFDILTQLNNYPQLKAVVPISALKGRNTDVLLKEIRKLLTDNIKYYPDDMYTDKNMRFMAAEIIREKTLRLLDKEVPYGIGVEITEYERRSGKDIIDISADILCEKAGHRPIIIGKGGGTLKKIATYARQDLENITGYKVFLTVFVKVRENWREKEYIIKELGYDEKK